MSSPPATRRIRSLADLPPFLASLGFRPAWSELPAEVARPLAGVAERAALLARHGEFTWLGVQAPAAGRACASALATLERAGRVAGVAALDPEARRLAIGVTGGASRLELALDAPAAVSLATLGRLTPVGEEGPLAQALRYADVLRGRGVGGAFFVAFRRTLDAMQAALPAAVPPADRHALALLQLTRVLFLYFVQSRGWLDGRPDFLARAVDTTLARKRRVHASLLRPLCFGTLNRPAADRTRTARAFGAVPFLNGGLFEPHPLERRWRADLPNRVWRDAFDLLFERFHFTIDESDTGAVAPDMLGHVFEGVMDPGQRHASGSFYTPAPLVRRLLDAALVPWVARALRSGEAEAERRLADGDRPAAALVASLTLLDPAAGSGAFLLGALDRLAGMHEVLGQPAAAARRLVLERQLFGVDRNATAVRLAELRLWLRVLAADDAFAPGAVTPLPNLDALVRQGDMLLDPVGALAPLPAAEARRLAALRAALVRAHGAAKREAARALADAERAMARAALQSAEARVEREIRERLAAARACGLFGDRAGLDAEGSRALAAARARRRQLRQEHRRLADAGELPWFHCESLFADVAARGGFDLVVGNPPWVRAEALPERLRRRLAERYQWWRSGGGPGFRHAPDLSVAFLERAFELVHRDGVVALLLPAKLATTEYAARARESLAHRCTIATAAPLAAADGAVFEATVYPLALVAAPGAPPPGHAVRLGLDRGAPAVPQATLRGGPWLLQGGGTERLLREVGERHPPLRERVAIALGVKTGADRLFLTDGDGVEPSLLRWAIRGRDVAPFAAVPRRRLIWTHDAGGRPLAELPPGAMRHFRPHLDALRARADYRRGPAWTLFRTRAASCAHRVIWPDLAPRLEAVALGAPEQDGVPLNTCLVAPMPEARAARRLAAWLNAPPLSALARLVAPPAAGGCARHGAHVVGALPLPPTVLDDASLDPMAALPPRERADALTARALELLDLAAADRARLVALVAGRPRHRR